MSLEYYLWDEQSTLLRVLYASLSLHTHTHTHTHASTHTSEVWSKLLSRIQQAEHRMRDLEAKLATRRVAQHVRSLGIHSAVYKWVPEDYYDQPLEQRGLCLGCSTPQMCKTIVFENKECARDDCLDPTNSKYYCVLVPYERKFNAEKLRTLVHTLQKGVLPKKRFNFQLADEDVSAHLTGFIHNAVTPFGLQTNIPVIMSEAILKVNPPFIWMGGGHVNLKLGMATQDFVDALKPFVGDICDAR